MRRNFSAFTAACALALSTLTACGGDEPSEPVFTVQFQNSASTTANESATLHFVTVTLSGPADASLEQPLSFNVVGSDLGATADVDYQAVNYSINFPFGASDGDTRQIGVQILGDAQIEGNEALTLTLQNANGGVIGTQNTHRVTISDDDTASIGFVLPSSATPDEADGVSQIQLTLFTTLGASLPSDATVDVVLVGGSATDTVDFTFTPQTITFPAGSSNGTNRSVDVTIIDDGSQEGPETVVLGLTNVTGPVPVGTPNTHTLTITDDEVALGIAGNVVYRDTNADGEVSAGDTLTVPMTEDAVVNAGNAAAAFDLFVSGDSLGTNAVAAAGPGSAEITITLGTNPRLRARGAYTGTSTTSNSPSGIDISATLPADAIETTDGADAETSGVRDIVAGFADIATGFGPSNAQGIATGDLDGDGDLDVYFSVDGGANQFWRNTGNGTLVVGQALGSSDTRRSAIGDVDGDADLDIVDANSGQANLVWTNDGSGSFTDSGQTLGSANSNAAVLVDVDQDGDLDAVFANENQGNTVWTNDGNGVFTDSGQSLGTADSTSVAAADLDFDGDVDLAFGNALVVSRVWENDGVGVFSSGAALSATTLGIALGDVDGDGDVDAACLRLGANQIWNNDGGGGFTTSGQSLGSDDTRDGHLVDMDADGDLDLTASNVGAINRIWLNDGAGTFGDGGYLDLVADDASSMRPVDLDGDGDADLVTATAAAGITTQRSFVSAAWGETDLADSGQALGPVPMGDAELGDLNGDGVLDLFIATNSANLVFVNDGTGTMIDTMQSLGFGVSNEVELGDVDGDGDLDAVVANQLTASLVWVNDGLGNFSSTANDLGSGAATGLDLGDVDGDGDLDVVISNTIGQPDRVYLNNGSGTFTNSGQSLGTGSANDTVLADFDKDGDLDQAIAVFISANTIWNNNGSGVFTNSGQVLGATSSNDHGVADVDRDGDLDLIEVTPGSRVWLNNGSGTFSNSGQILGAGNQSSIDVGDFNGDGAVDLVIGTRAGTTDIYLNDGSGTFTALGLNLVPGDPTSVVKFGDLDNDGDLDLFIGGGDYGTAPATAGTGRIFLNE